MAEEAKVEIEYTEIEQEAIEEGWIPPDRFEKAGKDTDFKTAEQFMENSSFFRKIKDQRKQIEDLQSTVAGITDHQNKVAKRDLADQKSKYEETISELKAQKVQALDEGDHKQVVDIDEKIRKTQEPVAAPQNNTAIIDTWKAKNSWYESNEFLGMEADILSSEYANRGEPLESALTKIEAHLKRKYPAEFENKNRNKAPNVEGGSNLPANKGKIASDKDLTPDEKTVYAKFNRMGVFEDDKARKQYFAQVIKLRD